MSLRAAPDSRLGRRLERWRGRRTAVLDLSLYHQRLEEIRRRGAELARADDDELRKMSIQLRRRAENGSTLDRIEIDAFALVAEACSRTLDLQPFDVQILAALAMRRGQVIEMQTGEGKTLAAVFTVYLNALAGRGAHVLTFNDYLARRDASWMGPIYRFLGLTVAAIQQGMSPDQRRRAYAADVTYVTAKEAGFDLLRDALRYDPAELVQRPFDFALVDEADSLLIDEARIPLVIAGSANSAPESSRRMAEVVRRLEPEVHYEIDDYGRSVDLTDSGREHAERLLGCGDLLSAENLVTLTELNCALHAAALLQRDVDYILRDGKIRLVDELTGRVVKDRHWPDGLQAALEAKEGLELQPEGRILGSITLQHFLRLYPRLCGMSGTTEGTADELAELYGLDVVVIPTHRESIRRDDPDVVFTHQQAKLDAIVDEIRRVHAGGRPVLVGTLSVAESERLGRALRGTGIDYEVLNAKNDEREARIVARAGAPGAVTISTNMAGRGTDIRLGGLREEARDTVVRLGGLYVIGTNRHESVRIDQQLRGRAGRQGDPGSTRFFISLEDELIVRYGIARLIPERHWPAEQAAPLDNPVITHEIARAQRIVDGQNHEIRRNLWQYSERIDEQRKIVHDRRRELLADRAELRRFAVADPERYAEVSAEVGEAAVRLAEKQATLFHLDRGWSEHLARIADLREGIHLLSVGGQDPLTEFVRRAAESFRETEVQLDQEVLRTLREAPIKKDGLDLEQAGLRGPSSTRTYLINDDPFRDQLAIQIAGNTGFAAAAALYAGPILVLWGLYNRYFRRAGRRGAARRDRSPEDGPRACPSERADGFIRSAGSDEFE